MSAEATETIRHAVLTLAGRCDGARDRDGAGFNRYDVPAGHDLARRIEAGQEINPVFALKLVTKYRGQLARAGIELPTPEVAHAMQEQRRAEQRASAPTGVTVAREGKTIRLRFPYDPALVEIARGLPGRRFDPATKAWLVPASALGDVLAAFPGATLAGTLAEELAATRAAEDAAEHARTAQIAADVAAYERIREACSLYEHQDAGVRWLIEHRTGILADDMGLGKTRQSLVAARALGHRIIVVAPAGLRINWLREAEAVDAQIEIYSWAKVPDAIEEDFTLIADECFPFWTSVMTDRGPLSIGEIVEKRLAVSVASFDSVYNELVWKPVTNWIKRGGTEPLVEVHHETGSFVCTARHKIWTENGYVEAAALARGTMLCTLPKTIRDSAQRTEHSELLLKELCVEAEQRRAATTAALLSDAHLRVVSQTIYDPRKGEPRWASLLRSLVLEHAQSVVAGIEGQKSRSREVCASGPPWAETPGRGAADATSQSDEEQGDAGEDARRAQGPNVPLTRRKFEDHNTTANAGRPTRLVDGTRDSDSWRPRTFPVDAAIVQSGSGTHREQDCDRGGWEDSPSPEMEIPRPSENSHLGRSRVVRVEILERGRDGRSGEGRGHNPVYDLTVEDTHNYFANGVLVSNCHYAQNVKAARTKRFLALAQAARAVFLLTGTPIKNGRPVNLFPLLLAIRHPLAREKRAYEIRYCAARATRWTQWDVTGAAHLDELHRKLADAVLRRMKDEVLDLPALTRVVRQVEMSDDARATYDATVRDLQIEYRRRKAAGEIKDGGDALVLLGHLFRAGSIAKCPAAIEMAEEILEQGGQVVLFVKYLESAAALAEALGAGRITGEEDAETRQRAIDRFQRGELRAMVCTLGAGNVGINLTPAAYCLLVDRPWTPGDAEQAEARINRIGQTMPVTSVWLEANGADRALDALLNQKQERIELVLAGKRKTLRGIGSLADVADAVLGE